MPRTNEKDAYYFPHDCNARNDPKVLALRSVFGAEGYGVYFMTVEILREQPDYRLKVTKYLYNALAMQMQVQADKVQEIIEACCTEFTDGEGSSLLVNDGEYLYSASLLRRMDRVDTVSEARRAAARKRWENGACKGSDGEGSEDGESKQDANAEQKQSKGNKRKENKTRPDQRKTEKKSKDLFAAFAGDDADLLSALHGYEGMRNKIKKPMTDEAKKRALDKLVRLAGDREAQIAILHQSEDRCWAGLFPLKDDGEYRTGSGGGRGHLEARDKIGALQGLYSRFAEGDSV